MKYKLDINNRAFNAIKKGTKKVEIRVTTLSEDAFDYSILKPNDILVLKSSNEKIINCIVKKVNHYSSIEELLNKEGTKYTLSSTDDFDEGIKSINSLKGYKKSIPINGIYAIHLKNIDKFNDTE